MLRMRIFLARQTTAALLVALVLGGVLLTTGVTALADDTAEATAEKKCDKSANESKADAEFVTLFDGKTLNGWTPSYPGGYVVENGVIVCLKDKGGRLFTNEEYGDFVFRFEFKLTADANNGLGVRTPRDGDPAYAGMEIQILDNSSKKWPGLQPWQVHGSIYGVVAAKTGHLKPVGEWNSQEVTCRGKHVVVKLNGATIVDADIEKASDPTTADGNAHPGLKRAKGYIAFCGHGSRVEFRNIRVKSLDK